MAYFDWRMVDRQRLIALSMFGTVAGMFLLAHPYFGIWHDSILYTAQALSRLQPEIYSHDLFFRFGSQDDFTVFPAVHAWLIELAGIERAALLLTVVGKLFWLTALFFLASAFLRGFPAWLGLALVATFLGTYDGNRVLSYGESFATARIFAEALVLFAVGYSMRGRHRCAVLVALAAMFVHPLMAIPGVAATVLLTGRIGRRAVMLGVLSVVIACLLAGAGVSPFVRLAATYDPAWLTIAEQRNSIVFLDQWEEGAFGRLIFVASILVAAGLVFKERNEGRLARCMLLLGLACLVGAWIGGTLLHAILLTQLQLWRGLWLVQIAALLLLAALTAKAWTVRFADRLLLVGLWSASLLYDGIPAATLAVCSLATWFALDRFVPRWKPTRAIVTALLLFPLGVLAYKVLIITAGAASWQFFFDRQTWQTVIPDQLTALGLLGLVAWLGRRHAMGAILAVAMGGGILVFGVASWDRRPMRDLKLDDPVVIAAATPLQAIIPTDASVFWSHNLWGTWFWLHRSHYASTYQTAGVLFSRQTAMLGARRQVRLLTAGYDDGYPQWGATMEPSEGDSQLSVGEKKKYLCEDPELGFLILPTSENDEGVVSRFVYPIDNARMDLVDCRKIRASAGMNGVTG